MFEQIKRLASSTSTILPFQIPVRAWVINHLRLGHDMNQENCLGQDLGVYQAAIALQWDSHEDFAAEKLETAIHIPKSNAKENASPPALQPIALRPRGPSPFPNTAAGNHMHQIDMVQQTF